MDALKRAPIMGALKRAPTGMNWERFNQIISEQEKRGFDKYVLGPFLLYCGVRYKNLPRKVRRMLVGAGIFQIFYSWRQYAQLQQQFKDAINHTPTERKI